MSTATLATDHGVIFTRSVTRKMCQFVDEWLKDHRKISKKKRDVIDERRRLVKKYWQGDLFEIEKNYNEVMALLEEKGVLVEEGRKIADFVAKQKKKYVDQKHYRKRRGLPPPTHQPPDFAVALAPIKERLKQINELVGGQFLQNQSNERRQIRQEKYEEEKAQFLKMMQILEDEHKRVDSYYKKKKNDFLKSTYQRQEGLRAAIKRKQDTAAAAAAAAKRKSVPASIQKVKNLTDKLSMIDEQMVLKKDHLKVIHAFKLDQEEYEAEKSKYEQELAGLDKEDPSYHGRSTRIQRHLDRSTKTHEKRSEDLFGKMNIDELESESDLDKENINLSKEIEDLRILRKKTSKELEEAEKELDGGGEENQSTSESTD